MAFNGSGVFGRLYNWVNDKNASVNITASRMDAEMDGMATGLSTCITKDGQTTITANLPMAGFRHTGVGNAQSSSDYAAAGQVQNSSLITLSTVAGTNTVTGNATPTPSAYAAGQRFQFIAAGTCTGAATLNVSSLGAKAVQKNGAALVAGDITAGDAVVVIYDGTQFQMVSPARTPVLTAGGIGTTALAAQAVTYAKIQNVSATSRLLGRATAGAGSAEEITISQALDFVGTPADGDILYRTGGVWTHLAKGSDTNVLTLASGLPSWAAQSTTTAATQADQETATSITTMVTPGRQQFHPSAAKCWANVIGNGTTVNASYNLTSIALTATGRTTFTIGTDFSSANYSCVATVEANSTTLTTAATIACIRNSTPAAGTIEVDGINIAGTSTNPTNYNVAMFGDQ